MIKIKICGMRDPDNIKNVKDLKPDFMGFIFYDKSPRAIESSLTPPEHLLHQESTKTVGVFVNASLTRILALSQKYNLAYIQLHGNEPAEDVSKIKSAGIAIIKAFRINEDFDWSIISAYKDYVDYFLFDTAGKNYGGNGFKFNWNLLNAYKLHVPFFLSGGIGPEDITEIKKLNHPQLYAVDINSKIETAPGFKNITLVEQCVNNIRYES